MSQFKVIRVFVNNEPDQYHVTKGGFGKFIEPLCITHSKENALIIAKCVNCFDPMRICIDTAIEFLNKAQTEVEEHERENHE